jgi:hypothetical protein
MLEIRRGTGYPWARRGLAGLDTCSVTRIWSGRHPGSAGPLPLLLSVSHLPNQSTLDGTFYTVAVSKAVTQFSFPLFSAPAGRYRPPGDGDAGRLGCSTAAVPEADRPAVSLGKGAEPALPAVRRRWAEAYGGSCS